MKPLTAYHGNPDIKNFLVADLQRHQAADALIKGTYWSEGKGCAVGCTLESMRRMEGLKTIDRGSR